VLNLAQHREDLRRDVGLEIERRVDAKQEAKRLLGVECLAEDRLAARFEEIGVELLLDRCPLELQDPRGERDHAIVFEVDVEPMRVLQ
jgi:hypothetical protein